jgi:hypothetical protein
MAVVGNRILLNFIINAVLTYIKKHHGADWSKENVEK